MTGEGLERKGRRVERRQREHSSDPSRDHRERFIAEVFTQALTNGGWVTFIWHAEACPKLSETDARTAKLAPQHTQIPRLTLGTTGAGLQWTGRGRVRGRSQNE